MSHSILNIEENISITENYFLIDSLDDWIHGMMTGSGYDSSDEDSDGRDEYKFWKAMYFKNLGSEYRYAIRAMINQVEHMAANNKELCEDSDDEDDTEDNTVEQDQDYSEDVYDDY